jgi:hypothetical protein
MTVPAGMKHLNGMTAVITNLNPASKSLSPAYFNSPHNFLFMEEKKRMGFPVRFTELPENIINGGTIVHKNPEG